MKYFAFLLRIALILGIDFLLLEFNLFDLTMYCWSLVNFYKELLTDSNGKLHLNQLKQFLKK